MTVETAALGVLVGQGEVTTLVLKVEGHGVVVGVDDGQGVEVQVGATTLVEQGVVVAQASAAAPAMRREPAAMVKRILIDVLGSLEN